MSYTKGKYSIERLVHFSCFKCKKWWTIVDAIINSVIIYSCPHCHTSQKFESTPTPLRESIQIEGHTVIEVIPPTEIEDASSVRDTESLQEGDLGSPKGESERPGGTGTISAVPPAPPWE